MLIGMVCLAIANGTEILEQVRFFYAQRKRAPHEFLLNGFESDLTAQVRRLGKTEFNELIFKAYGLEELAAAIAGYIGDAEFRHHLLDPAIECRKQIDG